MFIDEADIVVKAGKGGDGAISFRRERFIPNGGPDGGDGGKGGDVRFIGHHNAHTLSDFRAHKSFSAEDGRPGSHKKMYGHGGQDCEIVVPLGTIIQLSTDGSPEVIRQYDITAEGQTVLVARGGNGGWGNSHFATSIKQAPAWSKKGLDGEKYHIKLELKLIADVGLVGFPNAGKSTLLSILTHAKPKIASYPFTTLEPQLGVLTYRSKSIVIADVPGLIEGSSQNKGLGHAFLKHLARTATMLFLIDATDANPDQTLTALKRELKTHDSALAKKPSLVVINKIDLLDQSAIDSLGKSYPDAVFISCSTGSGVERLKQRLMQNISGS